MDKGIQGSAYAARETHKNVGIAKVVAAEISGAPRVAACRASPHARMHAAPPPFTDRKRNVRAGARETHTSDVLRVMVRARRRTLRITSSHTRTHTHTHTHSLTHSRTHAHSLSHARTHTHTGIPGAYFEDARVRGHTRGSHCAAARWQLLKS